MRGVLLCHGRNHSVPLPNWLPDEIEWIYVDIDPNVNPDIVGSYKDFSTLEALGLFTYDYVVSMHCPAYKNFTEFRVLLRAGRWLLKPSGIFLALSVSIWIPQIQERIVRFNYTRQYQESNFYSPEVMRLEPMEIAQLLASDEKFATVIQIDSDLIFAGFVVD